ncbi:MAG: DUF2804 domain-containing protein, partial [Polyangiaceae bacterium]|nr:DUF2804 domain-containing protein [Polyangiaceae bacterium]
MPLKPSTNPPTPTTAPDAIVDAQGQIAFGVYDRPFKTANLADAPIKLGSPPLGPLSIGRVISNLRLKEWQHFAVVLPQALLTFAVVNTKVMATSWCHFVNIDGTGKVEHKRTGLVLGTRVARDLWNDTTCHRSQHLRIDIHNHLDACEHRIQIRADGNNKPSIAADLRFICDLNRVKPLDAVIPLGKQGAMYTQKVPLPVEGTIRVGNRVLTAHACTARAIIDIHKGYYPLHTWWNWATFVGRDDSGRSVCLNLAKNVNDRDDEYTENALWVDDSLEMLGPARF